MILAAVKAAALAITVGAAAPAFSISATPAHINAAPGSSHLVHVRDGGTRPVRVRVRVVRVKPGHGPGHCQLAPGTPGVTVHPAELALQPGQTAAAHVTIASSAPAADDAVMFASSPVRHGNVRVSGAVGSRLIIDHAPEANCQPARAAASAPGASVPYGPVLAALAVLAALLGTWAIVLRRRRRAGRHA